MGAALAPVLPSGDATLATTAPEAITGVVSTNLPVLEIVAVEACLGTPPRMESRRTIVLPAGRVVEPATR